MNEGQQERDPMLAKGLDPRPQMLARADSRMVAANVALALAAQ